MTETAVPSFKKIRDSIPGSTAPRTLDAAIEFLDQLDGAIDLDDVGLKVYGGARRRDLRAAQAQHQSQDFENRARRQ